MNYPQVQAQKKSVISFYKKPLQQASKAICQILPVSLNDMFFIYILSYLP